MSQSTVQICQAGLQSEWQGSPQVAVWKSASYGLQRQERPEMRNHDGAGSFLRPSNARIYGSGSATTKLALIYSLQLEANDGRIRDFDHLFHVVAGRQQSSWPGPCIHFHQGLLWLGCARTDHNDLFPWHILLRPIQKLCLGLPHTAHCIMMFPRWTCKLGTHSGIWSQVHLTQRIGHDVAISRHSSVLQLC